jgi:hypothetical protein
MKVGLASAALAVLLLATCLGASEPKTSDAQSDDLAGQVRSVSTKQETQQLAWGQMNAKAAFWGVSCLECEYDREGNRIKSGGLVDGEFRGDIIRIVRDETGRMNERIVENVKGEVIRRDALGPYGITEQVVYQEGKTISRSTWSYDQNGHVTEFYQYDQDGVVTGSSISTSDASGDIKEQWDYGPDGVFRLHFAQIYNPQTDISTFTSFNENGSANVTFTTKGTKVLSYWQQTDEKNVFGSSFWRDPVGRTLVTHNCNPDGTCDEITSHFFDEARHQVSRVEWHDPAQVLRLAFDYEYESDSFGNWTKRTVWVWSPELGERKLSETDNRTITYWSK